jgi:hypothetical protein
MQRKTKWASLILAALLAGVSHPTTAQKSAAPAYVVSAPRAEQLVGKTSRQVVAALQKNDMAAIARLMHPKGLRLAPYVNLTKSDIIFRRASVAALRHNTRIYNWGEADGTGDAIRLRWNDFRLRYLTPQGRDFLKGKMAFNTFKARGNLINNLRETYPGAIFVEFSLPGSDKYNFMDWRGLWLVWRPVSKTWRLCAIVGDQWTI